jgi:signal transduction histidine kinase/ligand-binding sensor domain-containing protein
VSALLCAALCAAERGARAQQLPSRHFDAASGLAHDNVSRIFEDSRGYFWFATDEGLSRFDGYSFKSYGAGEGLGDPIVNGVLEDQRGRIWAMVYDGSLARLPDDARAPSPPEARGGTAADARGHFVSFATGDRPGGANAALFDHDGALWCVLEGGVSRAVFDESDRVARFELIAPRRQPQSGGDKALADREGRLWFGMAGELVRIEGGREAARYGAADGVGSYDVRDITEDRGGRLFVANAREVYEFGAPDGGRGVWKKVPLDLPAGEEINCVAADSEGTLWIGTTRGLRAYRDGQLTPHDYARARSTQPGVAHLFVDGEGGLWIAAYHDGVYKLTGRGVVNYTVDEGLPSPEVLHVVEGRGGRIYVNVADDGIAEIVGGRAVMVAGSKSGRFGYLGRKLLADGRGDFWLQTSSTLYRFAGPELNFRRAEAFPRTDSAPQFEAGLALYEDSRGAVWSSQGKNLYRITTGPGGHPSFERIPVADERLYRVMRMAEDRSGALWLSSHGALGRLTRDGRLSMIEAAEGLPETVGRALFLDSRGWLWIGLRRGGVSVTRDPASAHPTFQNYSTREGLASGAVASITEDLAGRVYFGTGRGLDQFDPLTGAVRHLAADIGLPGAAVNHCVRDSRGFIWVATSAGLSRLDPTALGESSAPPPVYVSRVSVAGRDVPVPERGSLEVAGLSSDAAQSNIVIEFVGLSFRGERALRYQYMLEGADRGWSAPADTRAVNYANLAPGAYRFLVRALDGDGNVSARPAVVSFRVRPPLWRRPWFLLLAAASLAFAGLALYRLRVRQIRHEFALVVEERNRIAREMHDTLAQGFVGISVQLESVRETLGGAPAEAAHHLERARHLVRVSLAEARRAVRDLRPSALETQTLPDALSELAAQLTNSIAVSFAQRGAARPLTAQTEDNLFRVAQEAVTNALKHAVARRIDITLEYGPEAVRLSVRDDGCGYDPEEEETSGGVGLVGMRERARLIGATLGVRRAEGGGTEIEVEVKQ